MHVNHARIEAKGNGPAPQVPGRPIFNLLVPYDLGDGASRGCVTLAQPYSRTA